VRRKKRGTPFQNRYPSIAEDAGLIKDFVFAPQVVDGPAELGSHGFPGFKVRLGRLGGLIILR